MDPATILANLILAALNLELTKQQAALEGRTLNEDEIETFRQQLLVHEGDLKAAIQDAKDQGR